ncbi:hypothetical protein [Nitrospirillum amazonense]|uniref:hypothetical protein n=1 Tax=Nitrospirillum amazonense TaxID=28077 RepID=UPI0024122DF8|nr:hypothetical protein [Nitrospirillum amazonense]MDG3444607.1 hypothetical protein [Nitrospirillum amazonense]
MTPASTPTPGTTLGSQQPSDAGDVHDGACDPVQQPPVMTPAAGTNPFAACQGQEVIVVHTRDGRTFKGSYLTVAGMHFVHMTGPGHPAMGKVSEPFEPAEVIRVDVVRTKSQVQQDRHVRSRGEPFPGRPPVSRDDYEYRLQLLARAVTTEADRRRKSELRHQFDDLADLIKLSSGKRAWMLAAAAWSLTSNQDPVIADLWHSDIASPSLLAKPRPQDFDPDPAVRRRREAPTGNRPPNSVPVILGQLRAAGFKARRTLIGDDPTTRAEIQIDLDESNRCRFIAEARPAPGGRVSWRLKWGGNGSAAATRRYHRCLRNPALQVIRGILGLNNRP